MTSDLTPKHRLMRGHVLAESPRELPLSEDGRVNLGSCGQRDLWSMCLVDERDFKGRWNQRLLGSGHWGLPPENRLFS